MSLITAVPSFFEEVSPNTVFLSRLKNNWEGVNLMFSWLHLLPISFVLCLSPTHIYLYPGELPLAKLWVLVVLPSPLYSFIQQALTPTVSRRCYAITSFLWTPPHQISCMQICSVYFQGTPPEIPILEPVTEVVLDKSELIIEAGSGVCLIDIPWLLHFGEGLEQILRDNHHIYYTIQHAEWRKRQM